MKDVFICHAGEDKIKVVQPLVEALNQAQISCWYDKAEIKWGDSITQKINEGLGISRFVIVVLSSAFLAKSWPQRELYSVLNIEASDGKIKILPLIVGINKQEILQQVPLLNDKSYLTWNGKTKEIVDALSKRMSDKNRKDNFDSNSTFQSWKLIVLRIIGIVFLSAISIFTIEKFSNSEVPIIISSLNSCSHKNINPENINEATLISSETGENYIELQDLLKECKWKEAEDKTRQVMFVVAKVSVDGSLFKPLEKGEFPCDDLRIIDQLWREYSNGKFGFSVQQQIHEELGDWTPFYEQVGWLREGKPLYDEDLTYNLDQAPKGHLPRSLGREMGPKKGRKALFDRVKSCNW